jgi:CBS domain-containing protein
MTSHLISVLPDVDVQAAAKTMARNGISAVTVINERGELVGIVSEGDLVRREELKTAETRGSWWLEMFAFDQASDYVKSHSRKVRDVMISNVVTASPDSSLREIAELFEKHHIKRVPIVEDGKMIGIVSRANLVQALANMPEFVSHDESDAMLKREIDHSILSQPWGNRPFSVQVSEGRVDLSGIVYSEDERAAIRVAAENTPGVKAVVDNLRVMAAPLYY